MVDLFEKINLGLKDVLSTRYMEVTEFQSKATVISPSHILSLDHDRCEKFLLTFSNNYNS